MGIDFTHGFQNKSPQMSPGVGDDQLRGGSGFPAKGYNIQIKRTGFVQDFFWLAAKLFFQRLQPGEQGFRSFGGVWNQGANGIEEIG